MNEVLFKNASQEIKELTNLIQNAIKGTHFEGKVYYVGGCVRDMILRLPIKDIDIVVELPNGGMQFAEFMCVKENCRVNGSNPVMFETYGTAKFNLRSHESLKDIDIECVHARKEQYHKLSNKPSTSYGTIEEDAKRRDLTINSIYYNVSTENIRDYNNGIDDLVNMVIKTPSDPNVIFEDDPLRILRTIRFSCRFGWGIEKETWLGMIKNAHRLSIVSQERITDELSKILLCEKPSIGLRKMYYCGVLKKVLPDIYDTTEVLECKSPLVTVFGHTMNVLDNVQPCINNRLAALFHDIGQIIGSKTPRIDDFSASVTEEILRDMKYSNAVVNSVATAIRYHRMFSIYADDAIIPDKKIRKFINLVGDDLVSTVDLMQANNIHCTNNKKKKQVYNLLDRIENLKDAESAAKVKLPINGHDIMREFNLRGGAVIGKLLDYVRDTYFDNPSITREEALKIVENKIKELLA